MITLGTPYFCVIASLIACRALPTREPISGRVSTDHHPQDLSQQRHQYFDEIDSHYQNILIGKSHLHCT